MADKDISYEQALEYWESVPATLDGVLGGFANSVVPKVDIVGSQAFIRRIGTLSPTTFPNPPPAAAAEAGGEAAEGAEAAPLGRATLDVGAGIGRVTRNLLSKYGDTFDLLEPASSLISQARLELRDLPGVRSYIEQGMQDWAPTPGVQYWAIWCQWCLGHLADEPLVAFLQRCGAALQPGGLLFVKENNAASEDLYDETDSSVTRTDASYRALFQRAGLRILLTAIQKGMPRELFPVRMYALAPGPLQ